MDYYVRILENVTFSEKVYEKSLIWLAYRPPGTDKGPFNRPKSGSEGQKQRNCGACRIIRD